MVNGVLTINSNPPYLAFQAAGSLGTVKTCTLEEIKLALIELTEVDTPVWPLEECIVRLPGDYPQVKLARFGLIPTQMQTLLERSYMRIAN